MRSTSSDAAIASMQYCFVVMEGRHRGAQFELTLPHAVVVGSSSEADFILSDPGVAKHHCLLSQTAAGVWVRALETTLEVDSKDLPPGEQRLIDAGALLVIGEARVVLQKQPHAASDTGGGWRKGWRAHFGKRWAMLLLGLGLLGGLGFTTLSHRTKEAHAGQWTAVKESTQRQGTAASSEGNPNLASKSESRRSDLAMSDPRLGAQLAQSVKDILRLSKIEAQTRYLGEGKVEVIGHLGRAEVAAAIIQSRAMREIEGLNKILAVNLDNPAAAAPPLPADKRVINVVEGADPYLVTGDGSRYYPGAILPNGMRLRGILGQDIQVQSAQGVQRIVALGAHLDQLPQKIESKQ